MNTYNRPRNREVKTKRGRGDEPVEITFELGQEEWEQAQQVMLRYGYSVVKVFRAGIEALQSF